MKKVLFVFMMLVSSIVGLAQSGERETTKPLRDAEIVRKCLLFDIEGQMYENVVVTLKSNDPDFIFSDKYKVKVSVTDASGANVWSKTFKNAFLYVFSNGQIQVGRRNFDQILIQKSVSSDMWIGMVREKEGVY